MNAFGVGFVPGIVNYSYHGVGRFVLRKQSFCCYRYMVGAIAVYVGPSCLYSLLSFHPPREVEHQFSDASMGRSSTLQVCN